MKSTKIDDTENLTDGASASAKFMERMTALYLNRVSGKPGKSVRTRCPTITPHWVGSFSDEGYMMVKTNRYLSAKIYMIWETTTTGVKNDRQIFINQLYSHDDMVVIGRQAHIIQRSGKSVDVRKFSN